MSPRGPESKVLERGGLIDRFGPSRKGRLVFTNGVFDLLHPGHIGYLAAARELGDALVVGVNSDASVRRLGKGSGRPVNAASDRALMIAGLESVDAVCLFDEDTPGELIQAVRPDILVKGGDYDLEGVIGRETVEAAGGCVVLIPFVEGYSTTDLVQRIQDLK
jgi:rfaE bifunctional protein nucleotidyltransferase chain/domain